MTTHIFKPDGHFHGESKNLRGLLDNARRRGVKRVGILELQEGARVRVIYEDEFSAVTNFKDVRVCLDFFDKRWPCKVKYTPRAHTARGRHDY